MNFTFTKEERLCSRKDIEALILRGHASFLYPFKIHWILTSDQNEPIKIAFAVPKKRFKRANQRNLIKRRMRESYRLQKPFLIAKLGTLNLQVHLLLVYSASQVMDYHELDCNIKKMVDVLWSDIQKLVK